MSITIFDYPTSHLIILKYKTAGAYSENIAKVIYEGTVSYAPAPVHKADPAYAPKPRHAPRPFYKPVYKPVPAPVYKPAPEYKPAPV